MKKIYLFLFLLLLIVPTRGQDTFWEISGQMPFGISGGRAVAADSVIYVLGGYSDSVQAITNWIMRFDPRTNTWTFAGNMKRKRIDMVAGYYNNAIYYFGGEMSPHQSGGPFERFDLNTNNSMVIDSSKLFNRRNASGIIIDGKFYVTGGGVYFPPPPNTNPYIFEYNISLKSFTYKMSTSMARFPEDQMINAIGNHLYIFGGLYNTVSRDIYRFNIQTHYYKKLPQEMQRPRSDGKAIRLRDTTQLVLVGGYNESSGSMSSVEMYDVGDSLNLATSTFSSLNFRRKDFMAVRLKDNIYVFGGRNEFNQYIYAVERYKLAPNRTDDKSSTPTEFELYQNYPNPFNHSTVIKYSLPVSGMVDLRIYDLLGREVSLLVDAERRSGIHEVRYNPSHLSSGIYFYTMRVTYSSGERFINSKKLILIK